jgi:hypothetical protein
MMIRDLQRSIVKNRKTEVDRNNARTVRTKKEMYITTPDNFTVVLHTPREGK